MLNSFWGTFGQRSNMSQVEYVTDPEQYFDMLTSDQQDVTGVNYVSEEMVEMRWRNKSEFVESGRTNVVITAYTTAQARLKLYSYLEQLGPEHCMRILIPSSFRQNHGRRNLYLVISWEI